MSPQLKLHKQVSLLIHIFSALPKEEKGLWVSPRDGQGQRHASPSLLNRSLPKSLRLCGRSGCSYWCLLGCCRETPLLVRKKAQGCSRAGLSLGRSTQSFDRPQRSSAKSTNDPSSSCLSPVCERQMHGAHACPLNQSLPTRAGTAFCPPHPTQGIKFLFC